jgi:hypothetical protein
MWGHIWPTALAEQTGGPRCMPGQNAVVERGGRPGPAALTAGVSPDSRAARALWMVTVLGAAAAAQLPPMSRATCCNSSGCSSMGRPRGTHRASWWGQGLTEEVARCGGGASQRRSRVAATTQ